MKRTNTAILSLLLTAAIFPAQTLAGPTKCRVKIAIGPKASQDKDVLARRIAKQSGDQVNAVVFRQPDDDQIEAAIDKADILITIQRTSGESEAFVSAVALVVTTGNVIGDTAVPAGEDDRTNREIASWYSSLDRSGYCGGFDLFKLFTRLKSEKKCTRVVEIAEKMPQTTGDDRKKTDDLVEECRNASLGLRENGKSSTRHAMSVRFEGVPAKLQTGVFSAVEETDLDHEIRAVTTQTAQLSLACAEECIQGRFLLKLPFDGSWYQTQKKGTKDPLHPFEPLMKRLLIARAKCEKTLQKLPIQINLVDVSGETLEIDVGGTIENPKPKTRTPAEAFFRSGQ